MCVCECFLGIHSELCVRRFLKLVEYVCVCAVYELNKVILDECVSIGGWGLESQFIMGRA